MKSHVSRSADREGTFASVPTLLASSHVCENEDLRTKSVLLVEALCINSERSLRLRRARQMFKGSWPGPSFMMIVPSHVGIGAARILVVMSTDDVL